MITFWDLPKVTYDFSKVTSRSGRGSMCNLCFHKVTSA